MVRLGPQSHLDLARTVVSVAGHLHLVVAGLEQRYALDRSGELVVDQYADVYMGAFEAGSVDDRLHGHLAFDGNRRLGVDGDEGDIVLLGRGGGPAEAEGMKRAGDAAPLRGFLQRGEARAVVGAVGEQRETA